MPYETLDDIEDTEYNDFGNVTKSYTYNPVSNSVEYAQYIYNDNHQILEERLFAESLKSKTVNIYNDDGSLNKKEKLWYIFKIFDGNTGIY